jgi:hypothetical protein
VLGIDVHRIDVEVALWASGSARDFVTVGMPIPPFGRAVNV